MSSLALDVGGTFIKAAWIDGGRVQEPVVRVPIPGFLKGDFDAGARELSADDLDAAVFNALAALEVDFDAMQRTFVSGQMAGLAFVDESGSAVGNLITWQDRRYTGVDALIRGVGDLALADLGDGLRVGSPAVTMAQRGVPQGTYPTSLIAYVAGRIAGGRAERIHATDAGAWGLFDTRNMRWSSEVCAEVGLDLSSLPRVVRAVEPITPGSHVFTAIGDQQAALFGAGLNAEQVSVNLATGCQVSVLAHEFTTAVQTRPYLDSHLLHTITHLPAGRLLTQAISDTYGDVSDTSWDRAVADWDSQVEMRAALDAIVDGVTDAVQRLNADGREVLFSGGLVQRFTPLRDAIVDELGTPDFRVFRGDDAALAGLAVLADQET